MPSLSFAVYAEVTGHFGCLCNQTCWPTKVHLLLAGGNTFTSGSTSIGQQAMQGIHIALLGVLYNRSPGRSSTSLIPNPLLLPDSSSLGCGAYTLLSHYSLSEG